MGLINAQGRRTFETLFRCAGDFSEQDLAFEGTEDYDSKCDYTKCQKSHDHARKKVETHHLH
jgi:hypothetical protein